jgi:hypothetical protein
MNTTCYLHPNHPTDVHGATGSRVNRAASGSPRRGCDRTIRNDRSRRRSDPLQEGLPALRLANGHPIYFAG